MSWLSLAPDACDTCGAAITDRFYDAKTTHGPWAFMCHECFARGPGLGKLGVGHGQCYERRPDGRWLNASSEAGKKAAERNGKH